MRFVIAASTDRFVDSCRDFLGNRPGLDFRRGSVAETGWDCDAAILSFALAHDRYGGTPQLGVAQVLANERADGAPGVILATPPIPLAAASRNPSDTDVEKHVLDALDSCLAAYTKEIGSLQDAKILIHLEAAGIDRVDLGAPLRGIAEFLDEAGLV
ncbi:hypothetical protein PUR71_02340 [Streptomyces sp. SP17BM10]|uniref:hypothetical protein n=1 Tax=Streptomyces sp. SP17BM10 TaxID=3002530 RepID=UPI002E79B819|nr:hypothetical protein [Streptomyces sp. SP17BM10]MEE1781776.1 hypothetical protein [Streptomyces sp. SP17BM10]